MSRLAYFLTALWLSSAAAQPAVNSNLTQTATDVQNQFSNDLEAILDPLGNTIAFIINDICKHVQPIAEVLYKSNGKEPDMSNLTLVFMTSAKTIIYNLTEAPEEFPKERWFNPKHPLKIYLHGFTDNPTRESFQAMRNAFFAQEATKGQVNILALDASSLIAFFYLRSAFIIKFIGEKLGKTLAALVSGGMDCKNIHLIGHSLGSHIAGFTGQSFYSLTNSRVGRISGLDPAGPCFSNVNPMLRLSKEDADFVDIIHTDAGAFGIDQQIGHVDYWPNNGVEQSNCLYHYCSHKRAWELYAESVVTPEAFIAVKCNGTYEFRHGLCDYNDTSVMGYGTPADTRGTYYCLTNGEEPFAAGAAGLKYKDTAIVTFISNAVKDTLFHG